MNVTFGELNGMFPCYVTGNIVTVVCYFDKPFITTQLTLPHPKLCINVPHLVRLIDGCIAELRRVTDEEIKQINSGKYELG